MGYGKRSRCPHCGELKALMELRRAWNIHKKSKLQEIKNAISSGYISLRSSIRGPLNHFHILPSFASHSMLNSQTNLLIGLLNFFLSFIRADRLSNTSINNNQFTMLIATFDGWLFCWQYGTRLYLNVQTFCGGFIFRDIISHPSRLFHDKYFEFCSGFLLQTRDRLAGRGFPRTLSCELRFFSILIARRNQIALLEQRYISKKTW